MEEFALVEADFQQYYQLNLEELCPYVDGVRTGFLRYARLWAGLPPDSRIMNHLNPAASWSWNDEVMSRILNELSQLKALTYNANRGNGQSPEKPDEQFQPDYVKSFKEEYAEWQKEEQAEDQAETIASAEEYWKKIHPDVKFL